MAALILAKPVTKTISRRSTQTAIATPAAIIRAPTYTISSKQKSASPRRFFQFTTKRLSSHWLTPSEILSAMAAFTILELAGSHTITIIRLVQHQVPRLSSSTFVSYSIQHQQTGYYTAMHRNHFSREAQYDFPAQSHCRLS